MIENIGQAEKFLNNLNDNALKTIGDNLSLNRMYPLLDKAGRPHEKLKVVHIAGTSGKTSTSYYISSLLCKTGAKVGLSISPHIISITERLQINNAPASEEYFCRMFNEFLGVVGSDITVSYFEIMIVFILWVFEREKVDYVVLETGLGGLLDGTNVCSREDKVCVITDIGYDHERILGNTLKDIATQKAGIMHRENHVFMYGQTDEIINAVYSYAKQVNSILHVSKYKPSNVSVDIEMPSFQVRNWTLAKIVFDYIQNRDNLSELDVSELEDTKTTKIPGRMQLIRYKNKKIIIDGAHNPQKMAAFVSSFITLYPEMKVPVLLSIKSDKNFTKTIDILEPIASELIVCPFRVRQDNVAVSVDTDSIKKYIENNYSLPIRIKKSIKGGVVELGICNSDLCIATGSLYAVGVVIKCLNS